MFSKNQIQLTGNIARPAESRMAGESSVTRSRLIHNERIRRGDGEDIERIVAIDLDIWGRRGEAFAEHVTTKTPVYIEGRLQLDQWQQDGEPRSRLLVRVDEWQFLTARADSQHQGAEERDAPEHRSGSRGRAGTGTGNRARSRSGQDRRRAAVA